MGIINRLIERIRMKEVEKTDQVIMSMPTIETQPEEFKAIEKPKKKRKYNKLTRKEMWEIICKKHKFMNKFNIDPVNIGDQYIRKDDIWDLFVELNLHNSPTLTKRQKEKVKREIVDKI